MPLGDDPSLPPQPDIPQQLRTHNLLARGDRTFERSVSRRMHTKSDELKALLTALVAFQNAAPNTQAAKDAIRELDKAVVSWEQQHPKEVGKRGSLLPELKSEIEVKLRQFGLAPTLNRHVQFESGLGYEDIEHGKPVNLWLKTKTGAWLTYNVASMGGSAATNLSGGGMLAMMGLGVTLFTITAATGVGIVIGGAVLMLGACAVSVNRWRKTRKHIRNLERILANAGREHPYCNGIGGSPFDHEGHMEIVDKTLPYIIAQKRKKKISAGVSAIPVISLAESMRSIVRAGYKKVSGKKGTMRAYQAHALAQHFITHDCQLCQSIVAELFGGDEQEEWLRYQDFTVVAGMLMEKMRST